MLRRAAIFAISVCCMPLGGRAEDEIYSITPEPEWADPLPFEEPGYIPHDAVSNGVYYYFSDVFSRAVEKDSYGQFARKVLSPTGVQNGSEIKITFDPGTQTLELHRADVIREGNREPRLSPNIVSVLHREADLENFMVDGRKTVVLTLPDIRPGDIIHYSFTVRGQNPIMGGHYYRSFTAAGEDPWQTMRQRVREDPAKPLKILEHGAVPPPKRTSANLYEWKVQNPPIIRSDPDTPRWFDPFPWVEAGDMWEWKDVVRWALPLYARGQPLPPDLETEIEKILRLPTAAERAAAALRLVQDQVRYLGQETGIYSHLPRPPAEVYEKRHGDCKEKVLLLATILDRLGIGSWPVLVSSSWGRGVGDLLPSPNVFDHVILEIEADGKRVFVDPTRTHQRGPLGQIFIPDYGYGLRVNEGETGLIKVAQSPSSIGKTVVTEDFSLGDVMNSKSSRLVVETLATGADAESLRRSFDENSLSDLREKYLNFYEDSYPSIESGGNLDFRDDPEKNTFFVRETYEIPAFWQESAEDPASRAASISPLELSRRLNKPDKLRRKSPLDLYSPQNFELSTRVELPSEWSITPVNKTVQNEWFKFHYSVTGSNRRAEIRGSYSTLSDSVPAPKIQDYAKDVTKAADSLGYEFSYRLPAGFSSAPDSVAKFARVFILFVPQTAAALSAAVLAFLVFWGKGDQNPMTAPHSPALALAAIPVLATPALTAAAALAGNLYLWYSAFSPTGQFAQIPSLAGASLANSLDVALCVFQAALIPIFFLRRRIFPAAFAVFAILGTAVCALLTALSWQPSAPLDTAFVVSFFRTICAAGLAVVGISLFWWIQSNWRPFCR